MIRQMRLREVGYDSYDAYLKSAAWRDVKERYRASDLPQICMCGATEVDLHHVTYDRVGREELEDFVPLCRACHTQAHILEQEGIIELDLKGFYYDAERAAENAIVEAERKAKAAAEAAEKLLNSHDFYHEFIRTAPLRKAQRRPFVKRPRKS
jgi:hypothetical protein